MLRINLAQTSDDSVDLIWALINEIAQDYHIHAEEVIESSVFDYVVDNAEGRDVFVKWIKDKHGLTVSWFDFGPDDNLIAWGYDIQEDEALTMYYLKK